MAKLLQSTADCFGSQFYNTVQYDSCVQPQLLLHSTACIGSLYCGRHLMDTRPAALYDRKVYIHIHTHDIHIDINRNKHIDTDTNIHIHI